jgi:hypothetical protein
MASGDAEDWNLLVICMVKEVKSHHPHLTCGILSLMLRDC